MDYPTSGIVDYQRHALDFALDTLDLRRARPAAHHALDVARLELTIAALRSENRFLRSRIVVLERQIYPASTTSPPSIARSTAARPAAPPHHAAACRPARIALTRAASASYCRSFR